ncbi:hypothetical protein J0H58_14695 [bacterium]|nr:hypothetical protein [bacterium]
MIDFRQRIHCDEVPEEGRRRLIRFLHVPLDEFSLMAVRQCAASGQFGPPITIPSNPSMGWMASAEQYAQIESLIRQITGAAGVPPICLDLLAWDHAHD